MFRGTSRPNRGGLMQMQRLPVLSCTFSPKPILGISGPHNFQVGMEAGDQFLSEVFNVSLTCVSKKNPYLELERISGAAEVGQG